MRTRQGTGGGWVARSEKGRLGLLQGTVSGRRAVITDDLVDGSESPLFLDGLHTPTL